VHQANATGRGCEAQYLFAVYSNISSIRTDLPKDASGSRHVDTSLRTDASNVSTLASEAKESDTTEWWDIKAKEWSGAFEPKRSCSNHRASDHLMVEENINIEGSAQDGSCSCASQDGSCSCAFQDGSCSFIGEGRRVRSRTLDDDRSMFEADLSDIPFETSFGFDTFDELPQLLDSQESQQPQQPQPQQLQRKQEWGLLHQIGATMACIVAALEQSETKQKQGTSIDVVLVWKDLRELEARQRQQEHEQQFLRYKHDLQERLAAQSQQ
jgi:hypothetical protein